MNKITMPITEEYRSTSLGFGVPLLSKLFPFVSDAISIICESIPTIKLNIRFLTLINFI